MEKYKEWQFDGLVGPTHNYAGLATGNLAAARNAGAISNPRTAALQGLEKMRFVRDLGIPQAFFPPRFRPLIPELKRIGFVGNTQKIIEDAAAKMPAILASVYSSSFMWAANAATVTPSWNSADGKLHLTPANLVSHYHRAIEAQSTFELLNYIFHNKNKFFVHNFLFQCEQLGDEGAANHMLLSCKKSKESLNIFVYGESYQSSYSARQKRMASMAVAHLHRLNSSNCVFLQQLPQAINSGVFHNDVIAMSAGRLLIAHANAYSPNDHAVLQELSNQNPWLIYRKVSNNELKLEDAVATYLFNSQLLEVADGDFVLLAPVECEAQECTRLLIARWIDEGLIKNVEYINVRESMRNGGGPACLRLRVPMTVDEGEAIHSGVIVTDAMYGQLRAWITKHYRDRLSFDDLRDPGLINELEDAYADLERIIAMPGLYSSGVHRAVD
jgi:succinylarginine dihydrolase